MPGFFFATNFFQYSYEFQLHYDFSNAMTIPIEATAHAKQRGNEMIRTFNFAFEELPLVISGGIEAAFINGSAEIKYGKGLDWTIGDISVEGFGERVNGKRQWPQVPAPKAIADIVIHRLSNEWEGRVSDAVQEQIAEDHECERDNWADMRREERMLERF